MSDVVILNGGFQMVGAFSLAASSLALAVTIGHVIFYFNQRGTQTDEFMRGLACRMKALFCVMASMFCIDIICAVGLTVNYTMGAWYAITVLKAAVSAAYVAALTWLYVFYRSPHV